MIAKLARCLMVVAVLFILASPASAHISVIDSSPKPESTVTALISEIKLVFSGNPVSGEGTTIDLVGPTGKHFGTGCVDVKGNTVIAPVFMGAGGKYTVRWSVKSGDGHTNNGSYKFDYVPPKNALQAAGFAGEQKCNKELSDRMVDAGKSARAAVEHGKKADEQSSLSIYVILSVILVFVLVVLAVIVVFLIARKKSLESS
ncbi:copper resistance protein CopC [Tropheryma whipplei]|uniref:copper resistance CopC family protein n=1 Tax=Tropheryma whipplei TaxID=2039 RepID=UPI000000C920|nr:copper resistance CopC family protein [Tropheryma whipplei]CAD67412.1 putative membrane protein [Tropheryma whipplei TW08/27]